jgi:hypothetical protein
VTSSCISSAGTSEGINVVPPDAVEGMVEDGTRSEDDGKDVCCVVGGSDGIVDGESKGVPEGTFVTTLEGASVGGSVATTGTSEGGELLEDGLDVDGSVVGCRVGTFVGLVVTGTDDGFEDGFEDGLDVDGSVVGCRVGTFVGLVVATGTDDGFEDGLDVGASVAGCVVGPLVVGGSV